MNFLKTLQMEIESFYGIQTGLQVTDFVRPVERFDSLGQLLVEQASGGDINVALLFDRDILASFEGLDESRHLRSFTVVCEEISHFVYLCHNHTLCLNITGLEMEMQSEVDRVLIGFHGSLIKSDDHKKKLLHELIEKPYQSTRHEQSRLLALQFLQTLSGNDPRSWTPQDFLQLKRFFNARLEDKIRLSEGKETNED